MFDEPQLATALSALTAQRTPSRQRRRPTTAPRRRRRPALPAKPAADRAAPPLAMADDRVARIIHVAGQGAVECAAWRRLAWQLLGEARVARAAGDGEGCRSRLEELRRLRRKAAKAGAFAQLCFRRAERLRRRVEPAS